MWKNQFLTRVCACTLLHSYELRTESIFLMLEALHIQRDAKMLAGAGKQP
jgi:hypothetical protein